MRKQRLVALGFRFWIIAAASACDLDTDTDDPAGPPSANPGSPAAPSGSTGPGPGADASARDGAVTNVDAAKPNKPPPDPGSDPNTDPLGVWVNVTSNLAAMQSECGNLPWLAAKPDEGLIITGVALNGLWASSDYGATWHALGTAQGSATITNRISSIVFDPDHSTHFWESGIYSGGGAFVTTTNGSSFAQQGDAHHNDSLSVDFTDPARKTLLLGSHEQAQTVYRSTDNGQTWSNVGVNLPAGTAFSSEVYVVDSQTHLVGCSGWGGGTNGIFRTTNGGASWTQVSANGGIGHPLRAHDGVLYWFAGGGVIVKSSDDGQTWTATGNPSAIAGAPFELPDGRLAAQGNEKVMLSADHGATWSPVGDKLPFTPKGVAYSAFGRAFFAWHDSCGNNVPNDAIMRAHFDYKTQ